MHESIGSLNNIIKSTKEQLEANIASTQTYFNQNTKNLSKTIDILKENTSARLTVMGADMKDISIKMIDTQERFNVHSKSVNLTLDNEFKRIEQVSRKLEQMLEGAVQGQNIELEKLDQKNAFWKQETEQKNFTVFKEIANALKTLRGEQKTQKVLQKDSLKEMREEIAVSAEGVQKRMQYLDENTKSAI